MFHEYKDDCLKISTFFQKFLDVDFAVVHDICEKVKSGPAEMRLQNVNMAASYIFQVIANKVIFKLTNLLMIISQIFLLNVFIGYGNPFWGITVFFVY